MIIIINEATVCVYVCMDGSCAQFNEHQLNNKNSSNNNNNNRHSILKIKTAETGNERTKTFIYGMACRYITA